MSRHSNEMIERLENAGLGFYVKSTKTVHRLGNWHVAINVCTYLFSIRTCICSYLCIHRAIVNLMCEYI